MNENQGMTIIVKTVTRIILWMILLYGTYLILHGHLTPGGGFGGGVIISLAFLCILLAYGREFTGKWLNIDRLHFIEASSVLLFVIVGILGLALSGAFLTNFFGHGSLFDLFSGGTIPLLNIFIGVKVGLSLFLVVWVLAHINLSEGEES